MLDKHQKNLLRDLQLLKVCDKIKKPFPRSRGRGGFDE